MFHQHHENIQISRWLLHMQGQIKQVRYSRYIDNKISQFLYSSRFTSSRKYEDSFQGLFKIGGRTGDICNACVLHVKRWNKLSESERRKEDKSHFVDSKYVIGN